MNLLWLLAEWGGVIFALSAAYLLSKNIGKEKLAWILFLLADSIHALFYVHTGQTGLVYNQALGFIIAILGLSVSIYASNADFVNKVERLMLFLTFSFIGSALYFATKWLDNMTVHNFEWFVCFVSLSGTSILAANNKYSKYGFFCWMFCDVTLLYIAFIKSQIGIVLLRVIYTLIDINGIKVRFFNNFEVYMWWKKIMKSSRKNNEMILLK